MFAQTEMKNEIIWGKICQNDLVLVSL